MTDKIIYATNNQLQRTRPYVECIDDIRFDYIRQPLPALLYPLRFVLLACTVGWIRILVAAARRRVQVPRS